MKIIQINSVYGYASTGRTCMEFSEEMRSSGYDVYTACKNAYAPKTIQIGSKLDYKMHALRSRLSGLPGYYSKNATMDFLRYLDRLSPDIVHLRNVHSNYINVPMLLNYLGCNNIPTVITLHDCFMFTGKCVHPATSNCLSYQKSCGNCPQFHNDNKSWFFDRTAKILKDRAVALAAINKLAVIGVSNWVTEQAKKASVFSSAKIIKTIYNWINTQAFYPRESDLKNKLSPDGKPIILGVASYWNHCKGYDDFITLANMLRSEAQIVLIGKVAERNKIASIKYIDLVESTDKLAEYYSVANVFFNPTQVETFGKVTAEALSCGTPVVAFDVASNKELISNSCGQLVAPNDLEAMRDTIRRFLFADKSDYQTTCIAHVKKNFDIKKNCQKYADIYNQLLFLQ